MDPKDKQNVPAAVKLLNLLNVISSDFDSLENPVQIDQMSEIKLMSHLCQLFLTIFTDFTECRFVTSINQFISIGSLFVLYF